MTTNLTTLYGIEQATQAKMKSQTFTSSGTWTRPPGVNVVKVILVGGGGGGFNNAVTDISAGNGGNSIFFSTLPVIARGGQGGSLYHGGNGGNSTSIRSQPWYYLTNTYWTYVLQPLYSSVFSTYHYNTFYVPFASHETIFGNGGYASGSYSNYVKNGIPFMWGGPGEAGGHGSVTGGGGAVIYPFSSDNIWTGPIAMHGGSVPGFGERGMTPTDAKGASGGASFGNGGIAGNINSGGYGGGGAALFVPNAGAAGGGGGEICIREVSVEDKTSISVIIGSGGFASTNTNTASSGKAGLCIIFWQE